MVDTRFFNHSNLKFINVKIMRKLQKPALLGLLFILLLIGSRCSSRRHLTELRRPDISIEDTLKEYTHYDNLDFIQMDSLLKSAEQRARKSEFMKNISERIYLLVDNKVAFTVTINGQDVEVSIGKREGVSPTLIMPFTASIAKNVNDVLADFKLDQAEIFNVCHVVFMPCLKRMYSMPYLFETKMFKGKLDNYFQFVIKNPEGFTYHGSDVTMSATVVNVDGMFLVVQGLIGDPDIRLELTLDQAIELYRYIAYDALKEQSIGEKLILSKKYSTLVNDCIVYEREWH